MTLSPVWEHAQAAGWATVWLTKPNLVDKKISGSEQVADEQVVTVADGDMVLSAQPEKEMTAAMLLKHRFGHRRRRRGENRCRLRIRIAGELPPPAPTSASASVIEGGGAAKIAVGAGRRLCQHQVLPMLQKASTSDEEIRSVEATGSSGHSSQKHEEGKGWYKFDDECVRPRTEDSIKTPAAYENISMVISDFVLSPELCCLTNNRRLFLPSVLFGLIALDKYSDISQEHLFCLDISQDQTRLDGHQSFMCNNPHSSAPYA
uniref:Uncharacterized protein n=1 Tax=Oryza barthii TaxID=65489 RepID=A0A0D3HPT7_9ORYZ